MIDMRMVWCPGTHELVPMRHIAFAKVATIVDRKQESFDVSVFHAHPSETARIGKSITSYSKHHQTKDEAITSLATLMDELDSAIFLFCRTSAIIVRKTCVTSIWISRTYNKIGVDVCYNFLPRDIIDWYLRPSSRNIIYGEYESKEEALKTIMKLREEFAEESGQSTKLIHTV